jgi:uncharacterized protein with HEPN domain
VRTDADRVEDILRAIRRIERETADAHERFRRDEMLQAWVIHHLEIIGYAVKGLSDEYKAARPAIPCSAIAHMRDRLIHGYWDVDLDAVWQTIRRDLPQLRSGITEPR